MLTRRNIDPDYPGTLAEGQAISLKAALPLFTINGALSLRMENETGSLSCGAWADFVILKKDLRKMRPEEIGLTEVQTTVWKGEVVYDLATSWQA